MRVSVVIATIVVCAGGLFLSWWLHSSFSSRQILVNIITSYLLVWGFYWLASACSPVDKSARFLLTTMTMTLMVGALELLAFARIVDYRVVFRLPATNLRALQHYPGNLLDPELLHIHKPHLHVHGSLKGDIAQDWGLNPAPNYDFDIHYDRNGFRNATDYQSADLIVIGDSFVESWNVSDEELLTTHLAKLYGKTVVNLGQSAYGPQQELHVLRRFGIALQPKVCFWVFFEGNDLTDVSGYNETTANGNSYTRKLDTLTQRCFTRNLLWALVRIFRQSSPKVNPPSALFAPAQGNPVRMYFGYEGHALSEGEFKALGETRSTLAHAYELCRAHGIKLAVVFVPTAFRVYKGVCQFEKDSECQRWELNDLPQRLDSVVRGLSNRIQFVDLTPTLVEQAGKGSLVYFPDDNHWTPAGHRVVAQTLAESLKQ